MRRVKRRGGGGGIGEESEEGRRGDGTGERSEEVTTVALRDENLP